MAPQHSRPEDSKQSSGVFNLKYQLAQYASHHNNPVNIGIHLTCIPLILWSALIFAAKTGPLFQTLRAPGFLARLSKIFPPNAGILTMMAYCLYYIKLDKVAGLLTAPLFIGLAKHATTFNATRTDATKVATQVQIVAWGAQFIGHGVFEGRAPKLTENLLQALVLAPYFVAYEVLFALGYRPHLKAELDKLVEADIREWKARRATQTMRYSSRRWWWQME
ncbi:hypothetical protein BGZ65_005812 [Modicella reniformis]|uniref:DUF962-domain-containing protein n=1 Tax=Modicella reniformis TaxID=1440133 RepID=A0A9P6ING5_9FUNG|nr:hypothetical protein BGZ65_005812 [Modicella reniformis]